MAIASVFISYRRMPSAMLATLIAKELEARGIEVYVDTRKGDGGGPFPRHLLQAIEDHDIFVCLLANTTFESDWVKREIDHAFTMGKTMIPVFQESFKPLPETPDTAIEMLLMSQGVHVLDQQNIYVDEAIERLAVMIESSVTEPAYMPGDTTEIGERTYSLRPELPKSRHWLWLVVAVLIVVLGILLFQWVNAPIINAVVAGTQTAVALAGVMSDTPTDRPSLTPTDAPTATQTATETPPILIIGRQGGIVRTAPNGVARIIDYLTVDQQLIITGICPDGRYYRVNYDNQEGWVHTYWVQETEGDTSSVPVVEAGDC